MQVVYTFFFPEQFCDELECVTVCPFASIPLEDNRTDEIIQSRAIYILVIIVYIKLQYQKQNQ